MNEIPQELTEEYPWKGKYVDVGGGNRMHYLDVGRGEPLLFVHGNPTWSFYWRNLIKAFESDYRCIAVDHLGCGLSDKPKNYPYRLENHIENLSRLLDALDLKQVTLVVHDWGGPIGMGTALRYPDRFKRLIIFNTGAFEGPIPASIKMCRWPIVGPLVIRGLNGFLRVGLLRGIENRDRVAGMVGKGYLAPYHSWSDRIGVLRFIQDIPLEEGHPTRELFFKIDRSLPELADRPALIIWGEKDFCFTPEYRKGWQERFPDAEVYAIEDAGHWVIEDALERIVPLVGRFLTKNPLEEPST